MNSCEALIDLMNTLTTKWKESFVGENNQKTKLRSEMQSMLIAVLEIATHASEY